MTTLLLIDAQVNMFAPGASVHRADAVLAVLRDLLARAREAGAPVVHVRNNGTAGDPDVPNTPGWQIHPDLAPLPGETVLDKTTCDAFASTALAGVLKEQGTSRLVIAGMQSDYCINETTRAAAGRGFDVVVVADGHSTYDSKTETAAGIVARQNEAFRAIARVAPAAALAFAR